MILMSTKERLNRLVIGVVTMAADSFRNGGSRLSNPADLYGSRFCSSFRTSAIWIWVKENLGRLGRGAAGGGAELLAEVGVARRKAWPAVEKCLLKFSIIMDLSVVTVLPSLSGSGQLGGGALVLHGLHSVPELFGVGATGCKLLPEEAGLSFPD